MTTDWDGPFEDVLREHLSLLAPDVPLATDSNLSGLGLDSLASIQLLLSLEEAYSVAFPDDLLNADTFDTAGSLWRGGAPPPPAAPAPSGARGPPPPPARRAPPPTP